MGLCPVLPFHLSFQEAQFGSTLIEHQPWTVTASSFTLMESQSLGLDVSTLQGVVQVQTNDHPRASSSCVHSCPWWALRCPALLAGSLPDLLAQQERQFLLLPSCSLGEHKQVTMTDCLLTWCIYLPSPTLPFLAAGLWGSHQPALLLCSLHSWVLGSESSTQGAPGRGTDCPQLLSPERAQHTLENQPFC